MDNYVKKDVPLCTKLGLPHYTRKEELINAGTHGIGVIFALVAFVILMARYRHNTLNVVCISIYCASLFILYLGSTLYHFMHIGTTKALFRKFDHCSIFLLIAGTYTPICLVLIKGTLANIAFLTVWIVAAVGIALNCIDVNKFSKFSLGCYIFMGWSVVFIARPAIENLSATQLHNLIFGGIFYTVGAVLYVLGKKRKYIHSIWHLFVLAGSFYHFLIFCQ